MAMKTLAGALLASTIWLGTTLAQTATNFQSELVIPRADVDAAFGLKADLNPMAAYLKSGQTVAQLTSGAIDAQPALIAALAAGMNRIPCGTYRLNEGVAVIGPESKFYLEGGSPGCVTFNVAFPVGDIFVLNGTQRARVKDVTVNATVQRTSGAVFHLTGTYDAQFDEVVLSGTHGGDGWLLDGAANTTHIRHFDCRPPGPFIIGAFYAGACIHGTGNFADLHMEHGNGASWNYGVELTYGSGVYGDDFDFVVSGTALEFNPSSALGQVVYGVNLSGFYADTSKGDNILFEGTGATTDVQLTAPWASNSQSGNGIAVNNRVVSGLQLISPTILGNYAAGLSVLLGDAVTATDVHSFYNSRQGANLWDDIYIGATQSNRVSILGAQVGIGGTQAALGAAPLSRYGVNVVGGNTSGQTIILSGIIGLGDLTANCNIPGNIPPYTILVSGTNCMTPWSTYPEAVAPSTGTFTTASGLARWVKDSTKVSLNVEVAITTNGSGGGAYVTITLPFQNGALTSVFSGRDILTGKALTGTVAPNSSTMTIAFYDNTYPGANGAALDLEGTYESVD